MSWVLPSVASLELFCGGLCFLSQKIRMECEPVVGSALRASLHRSRYYLGRTQITERKVHGSGVGARQRAQRHRSRHEAPIGVRFAGPDKQVHLIEAGEMALRRRRGYERLDGTGQIGQGFGNGNQPLFALHGLFSHVPQTRQEHRANSILRALNATIPLAVELVEWNLSRKSCSQFKRHSGLAFELQRAVGR